MHRPLLCAVLLGLLACGGASPAAGQASVEAEHLISEIRGDLRVKKQEWDHFKTAQVNMSLRDGDLLNLAVGSEAKVTCSDLNVFPVPVGTRGVPCNVAQPVLRRRDSLVVMPRDEPTGEFPIVISPRMTTLLRERPTIRWTPVVGVPTYRVSIRGTDWSTYVTGKTEVIYPSDAPPLQPGKPYSVVVMADTRSSDEERLLGLRFTLIGPEEARRMREAQEKIEGLDLADQQRRFLVAKLYASSDDPANALNAEAIEQLEDLATATTESAVLRFLGELYLRTGLNHLAEERYARALELALVTNSVDGQALAQFALGQLAEASGRRDEAVEHLQQAVELYEQLGDARMTEEVQGRLNALR
jgi:hypothetical protein